MDQNQKDQAIASMASDIQANPPQTLGEEQVVHGLAQAELTGRIQNAAETYNLANDLDEKILADIGQEVFKGFSDDDESRADWLEQHTFWLSLYMQSDYAENSDQDRSWGATESVPILAEACDSFQARTYKIFFPNDTFVSAIPMRTTVPDRKMLEERAKRIGDHMSYQLGFQDRSYRMDKDALFLGVAVHGSFFTKTYFNAELKRFKVDNIRPTDLVVNYHVGPCRIDDLRRKTHVIYTTVGATEDMVRSEYLIAPAKPGQTSINDQYNTKVNEIDGRSESNTSIKRDYPAVLLEQHSYFDIDGNGQYLPYIVTIDAVSRKVLRMTIGYEADPQGNPLNNYKQVQYFTHYKYKENPDGFYGLGLGHAIGDLNSAVNIMLRQSMDAATLANDGNSSGFISERLGLEGDEIKMILGKLIKIPDTVGDMQNSIMMMKFPGPNVALIQLMEAIDQRAQRIGSVNEATTGSSDKVEQPTTYLAKIEQSLEQFSSVQMRLSNSFSEELVKIYKINQRYLPFIEYYTVNGAPEQITRADYVDDMMIQPIFDPKYSTQSQKVARAQAELNATMQNPVNQGRPQVYDEAFKRYLEALEVEDIELLIPPQPQVENFDNQILENGFFLMPAEAKPLFDVFPDQNHMQHLAQMEGFIAQYGEQLQPDQKDAVLKHHQKHQAYLYLQQNGLLQAVGGGQPTPPESARTGVTPPQGAATAAMQPQDAAGPEDMLGIGNNGPTIQ